MRASQQRFQRAKRLRSRLVRQCVNHESHGGGATASWTSRQAGASRTARSCPENSTSTMNIRGGFRPMNVATRLRDERVTTSPVGRTVCPRLRHRSASSRGPLHASYCAHVGTALSSQHGATLRANTVRRFELTQCDASREGTAVGAVGDRIRAVESPSYFEHCGHTATPPQYGRELLGGLDGGHARHAGCCLWSRLQGARPLVDQSLERQPRRAHSGIPSERFHGGVGAPFPSPDTGGRNPSDCPIVGGALATSFSIRTAGRHLRCFRNELSSPAARQGCLGNTIRCALRST